MGKGFRVSIILITAFFISVFAIIEANILYTAANEKPRPSDVIIVLGAHLWGDQPSPLLRYRLDQAVALYRQGYGKYIIVSGAQGDDELATEAYAMAAYLMRHNISKDIIYLEENSYSTYENMKYSKEIMDREGFQSAVIVTNTFHVYRALEIGKHFSIPVSGSPAKMHPSMLTKLKYYVREFFAVIKFLIIKK
ncbi:uncharacterized SAM-binding protein YcdF (DUF218 family) [Anaerosolibacter carboniphilus]|uniref:Uncharacterized SAM-binding protein YcdF (DUF218 family) n=1 Tax=Anaerosolibacter carboniphilus TaxID=1417629 RepID=A0A841L5P6_9FIRM|nr:YdcF family protein [Anaerosolibacter carboniphilus]MBB6217739.1 uncharacterized SAM-binding protein YcdF (DUF218 family) [Anaerosolibacter carboniphilus]